MTMPILPVAAMTAGCCDYETRLVEAAFTNRGIREAGFSKLRPGKPFRKAGNRFEAEANYVWRNLAFDLVARTPYSCMPVTADFDLRAVLRDSDNTYKTVRARTKELDTLVDTVCAALPIGSRRGLQRWGRALGAC